MWSEIFYGVSLADSYREYDRSGVLSHDRWDSDRKDVLVRCEAIVISFWEDDHWKDIERYSTG